MKNKKKYIKKDHKNFNIIMLALFSAGFSTFAILYCVQPILPIFSKIFHLTPTHASLSLSVTTITMALGMLFTGPISDYIGRKKIMISSLVTASLLTILCSFMNNWKHIILIRSITGLSLSGVTAVAMSYLSEEIHPKLLAFAIGLYISGNSLGGFFGRFITSFLSIYFCWKIALLIIGILSFISTLIFIILLPPSNNFFPISIHPVKLFVNGLNQCKDKILSKLFFVGFILMGCFITLFNYIGYRLISLPTFINHALLGSISMVYLTGIYSSPKAGVLTEIYGRSKILVFSICLMITGLIITQFNFLLTIIIGLMIFSAGFFSAHSVSSSWVGYHVKKYKGQATSLYLFFYYLGASIFGTLGGVFWYWYSWYGISIFILFMLIIGILIAKGIKK
ncbi:MFS transporter [Buchnera aphidicola (Taiwanaphis decaspermi)]|uniref:MFS transporter n=1 Tax=Buchnera aphidicola TaxID=9 RepID=UPI0031B8A593